MWTATQEFVNDEHQAIFGQTKDIPGWQEPGDSYKLYEMGYAAGDVILEIGTYGGRSAVVELRGALANSERTTKPQFFGLDVDLHSIWRTFNTIEQAGLSEYALIFYGNLQQFMQEFSIQPTMVFVDGDHRYEGVKRDLQSLSTFLTAGTPVLCHDYLNPENDTGELGVRQAVNEFVKEGYAEFIGAFGCSAFLLTTNQCSGGSGVKLTDLEFVERKAALYQKYGRELYEKLQHSEGDRAARLDAIHQLQHQLTHGANPDSNGTAFQTNYELKQELEKARAKIARLRDKVKHTEEELTESQNRIVAMQTSKFWQLRQKWFQVKRALRLTSEDA